MPARWQNRPAISHIDNRHHWKTLGCQLTALQQNLRHFATVATGYLGIGGILATAGLIQLGVKLGAGDGKYQLAGLDS